MSRRNRSIKSLDLNAATTPAVEPAPATVPEVAPVEAPADAAGSPQEAADPAAATLYMPVPAPLAALENVGENVANVTEPAPVEASEIVTEASKAEAPADVTEPAPAADATAELTESPETAPEPAAVAAVDPAPDASPVPPAGENPVEVAEAGPVDLVDQEDESEDEDSEVEEKINISEIDQALIPPLETTQPRRSLLSPVPSRGPWDQGPLYTKPVQAEPIAHTVAGLDDVKRVVSQALAGGLSGTQILDVVKQQLAAAGAVVASEKVVGRKGVTYRLLKSDFREVRTNQKAAILQCLADNGGEMTLEDLELQLSGYVKTVQTTSRLVAFYRKSLINEGFIQVE